MAFTSAVSQCYNVISCSSSSSSSSRPSVQLYDLHLSRSTGSDKRVNMREPQDFTIGELNTTIDAAERKGLAAPQHQQISPRLLNNLGLGPAAKSRLLHIINCS